VYLDCQIYENEGSLVVHWDTLVDMFPAGLMDDMFAAFQSLLSSLARGSAFEVTSLLPEDQKKLISSVNETETKFEDATLLMHELFYKQAFATPNAVAVITPKFSLTYSELLHRAQSLAVLLRQMGVIPNTFVAIVMQKV
jgi:pyochelin synthetase